MGGYVLVADGVERRAAARVEQLALDGWPVRAAVRPDDARRLLPDAEVVVLGEFAGSAATAQGLLRDIRAGAVSRTDRGLWVLATADTEAQIVSALSAGADMTVARTASVMLVSASVAALARREKALGAPQLVKVGALEIDPSGRTVKFAGEPVDLTNRELDVLIVLAEQPGRAFTRDEISSEVWGGPELKTSHALRTHVARMAGKFRAAGGQDVIQNVWGRGYKLNNDPEGMTP